MTTVIVDTHKHVVYADSRCTVDNVYAATTTKLFHSKKNRIVLCGSGSLQDLHKIFELVDGDIQKIATPDCPLLKLKLNRSTFAILIMWCATRNNFVYIGVQSECIVTWYGIKKNKTTYTPITDLSRSWFNGYIVTGSGSQYARTALIITSNPPVAIKTAAKMDIYTDSNIQLHDFSHLKR